MSESLASNAGRARANLWIETGVVFLVCVAPVAFNSMAEIYLGVIPSRSPMVADSLGNILFRAGKIALVLYVIARSPDSFARFGLRPFRIVRDLVGGVAVWGVLRLAHRIVRWAGPVLYTWLHVVRHPYHPDPGPSTPGQYVLLAFSMAAVGIEEELIYRAYLITRFEELFESTTIALLLTTVIFATNHGYQDPVNMLGHVVFGLVEGSVFCLFRRFTPVALAHALDDFIIIVRR
ncbi:MAG TPA: CPBP family intramembrane glutamic endopeptidase [Tepidisphaeraceae bacterium]|jgi:membrane protease YdiL (CAAX protease family)|nr:CPBP family intramembrane glutamic endopeptidase [Tepidisphaeraceae bacterium]